MGLEIDRLTRVIRNLYTTVYEQGSRAVPSNRIYTRVHQKNGGTFGVFSDWGLRQAAREDYACWVDPVNDPIQNGWVASTLVNRNYDAAAIVPRSGLQTDSYTVSPSPSVCDGAAVEVVIVIAEPPYPAGWSLKIGMVSYNVEFKNTDTSNPSNTVTVRVTCGADTISNSVIATGYDPSGLHHIVVTRHFQKALRVYVDGAQLGSDVAIAGSGTVSTALGGVTVTKQTAPPPDGPINILEELILYAHHLEASRVLVHYNAFLNRELAVPSQMVYRAIAPKARAYAALTTAGSDTSNDASVYGFGTGVTVQYNASVIDETQMWIAMRIRPRWASGSPPTTPSMFRWQDDASNRLIVYYDTGASQWVCRRLSAAAGANAVVGGSHSAYDSITLIAAWTSTQTKISLNGAAFQTGANTNIPTLSATSFDIGNGDNPSNTDYYWVAMGIGTLTDADAAALHAIGNRDPDFKDLPSLEVADLSFLWPCNDSSHTPVGGWGESVYA